MLKEVGVDCNGSCCGDSSSEPDLNIPWTMCCGQVLVDYVDGFMTCFQCGHVHVQERQYVNYEPSNNKPSANGQTQPLGSHSHMYYEKKRFYKPVTHFKEHLRRYMGARFTEFPNNFMEQIEQQKIDVMDRNAYHTVRKALKDLGYSRYYKEIFTIIYALGGKKPHLDDQIYHKCVHVFGQLTQAFERLKKDMKRHSMPSHYVCMKMLLQHFQHEPYYLLPTLKDDRLLKQAEEMIDRLCKELQ